MLDFHTAGTHDPEGSNWHRWDPHIHAPGTILNDQFGGDWETWLTTIENSDPPIRALGITDYYSVATYESVIQHKASGRLANVELIFPNVELRLGVGTIKGQGINVHLLTRPDAKEHLESLKRLLRQLTMRLNNSVFCCERTDLIRLGIEQEPSLRDNEKAALREGVKQFKVGWESLREAWEKDRWAVENVLIAVDAGKAGTSGLKDGQFAALRRDIERFSHIIFSSNENDRRFWLGLGVDGIDKIRREYNGPKPCLHGSDAHRLDHVGAPDDDRLCWIKGDLTFDTLEQAIFEPELRVRIGPRPTDGILDSLALASAGIENAPWFMNNSVPLNRGMVAIIGARGSGKTALADVIAAGGDALGGSENDRSFVARAQEHLGRAKARLTWRDGEVTLSPLKPLPDESPYPRVQYLSQQFVDKLCSPEGVTDELLREMKRVVFDAHGIEQRMGAANFEELLEAATTQAQSSRKVAEATLASTIDQLYVEWQRNGSLKSLEHRRDQLVKTLEADKLQRNKLVGSGSGERAKFMDEVSRAADAMRLKADDIRREIQALEGLTAETHSLRGLRAENQLQQLRQQFVAANLNEEEWASFRLQFAGHVDAILTSKRENAGKRLRALIGITGVQPIEADLSTSSIPVGTTLPNVSLSVLEQEMARLRRVIGIDQENTVAVQLLSKNIEKQQTALAQVERELELAKNAHSRMTELDLTRRATYEAIFKSIEQEESALAALYEPLKTRLAEAGGSLAKLSFSVRRKVNLKAWANEGENLMDLRRQGAFQGVGKLLSAATDKLYPAWKNGSSSEVGEALAGFNTEHLKDIIAQAKVDRKDSLRFGQWWRDISNWLYGTGHITIDYSIRYDEIEIDRQSPGTRGIVLLLLYLAIDQDDDRPLVIDQPEENLDPRSIYDDIVEHFRKAKLRRQIVIVTHNANLVVNADADQIVVAVARPHEPGKLPKISYQCGALENPTIREQVCDILEGGKAAFRERARRLRVRV